MIYEIQSYEFQPSKIKLVEGNNVNSGSLFWSESSFQSNGIILRSTICLVHVRIVFIKFEHLESKRVIVKTTQGNFGGDTGWYGVIPDINDSLDAAQKYPNSTLVGTAIVPEGLFQNEFVYDYTLQLGKMAQAVWAK